MTDNSDNSDNINPVNISYINKNYILKEIHNEIVQNLKKQIEILQKQLEAETENNKKLVDTIKLREQKEAVIEQQKLVKLQNDVKLIEETSEDIRKEKRGKGFFSFFKNKNI